MVKGFVNLVFKLGLLQVKVVLDPVYLYPNKRYDSNRYQNGDKAYALLVHESKIQ